MQHKDINDINKNQFKLLYSKNRKPTTNALNSVSSSMASTIAGSSKSSYKCINKNCKEIQTQYYNQKIIASNLKKNIPGLSGIG